MFANSLTFKFFDSEPVDTLHTLLSEGGVAVCVCTSDNKELEQ